MLLFMVAHIIIQHTAKIINTFFTKLNGFKQHLWFSCGNYLSRPNITWC